MAEPDAKTANEAITIRHCTALEEYRQCVALQKSVWGWDDEDLIPTRFFAVAHKIEGQVIGAFDSLGERSLDRSGQPSEKMVGFCLAVPGFRGTLYEKGRYLHSHMLAVLPEYRRKGVGRRLKLEQRREALERGIRLIEWTFDPLEWKNAAFNLNRLGAIARRYVVNQYGVSSSPLHRGLPTDRLIAEWWLDSPRVVSRVGACVDQQNEAAPAAQERVSFPLDVLERGDSQDHSVVEIQRELRGQLQQAFAKNLTAVGFATTQSTGAYLLAALADEP